MRVTGYIMAVCKVKSCKPESFSILNLSYILGCYSEGNF
ncbi:MAG: hypothetical protein AVDCRST_MAG95-1875 [uncultured Adhaeribacter sp.]|uniref:Uncharacterized protein n=1 Tax=uncultured Adhaeribacter sp. TaxID=448109 RepID=A0A6J4II40_9BACT|nr:MAG: hypothetical protein AVDCRST_MAG95-1875 [uncultured Adhaeribacter sp.]